VEAGPLIIYNCVCMPLSGTSSHHYVNQILQRLPKSQLHLSSKVNCVSSLPTENSSPKLELITDADEKFCYDHVIFACHSDDALRILQAGDGFEEEEARILESFDWNRNEVLLHSDTRVCVLSARARFHYLNVYSSSCLRAVLHGLVGII
jgi:predicted NAD/FAD-binding protein